MREVSITFFAAWGKFLKSVFSASLPNPADTPACIPPFKNASAGSCPYTIAPTALAVPLATTWPTILAVAALVDACAAPCAALPA